MKNKIISGILAALMIVHIPLSYIPNAFAKDNLITISSKEDFIRFSKDCTLDTWSQGKTVILTCDIDMNNEDFYPVPTFGGTFNGNGYTISGINLLKNGSKLGLFRYVQESGKITNLNVKASFIPGGSKSFIGGIVGENSGIIEQCSFDGAVKGENVIGGIAGNNTSGGKITACTSSGSITGENSTGGIAGKNEGFISGCTNNASVNTMYEEKKKGFSDLNTDVGSMVESYKTDKEENEEESVLGHSDTGGIVGLTAGIVQGCTNNAAVGYQHIGYNVGGIAGRQSGYLLGCKNFGYIQGRKDIGGIVGQVEPYILLNTSESAFQDVWHELDKLHSMIDDFIADTDSLGDDTEKHLKRISEYSKSAQNNTESLINQGTDFIDDNLSEINAQTAVLSNTLDKLTPVFESLENSGGNLSNAVNKLISVLDDVEIYAPDLTDDINDISAALYDISRAELSFKNASARARRAVNALRYAVEFGNATQSNHTLSELSKAIKDITASKQAIKTALEAIENIIKTKPDGFKGIGINIKTAVENIKIIIENTDTVISSLKTAGEIIDTLLTNTKIDFSEFRSAAYNIDAAVGYINEALHSISYGLKELGTAIDSTSADVKDYADDISNDINNTVDKLADSVTSVSYAADDIIASISDIKQIVSDLANEKPLEFVKLGDDFKKSSENLFDSLSGISGEIDELKNTVSNGKNKITDNLMSISNQFNLLMNLMADEFDELKNSPSDMSDIFFDASDEDIENTKQGKVADCRNFGSVGADRNTGGIAGAMAIEYSKDPEDDIEKPNTLNFTYRTKAILQACINDGKTAGKKDCTGGIVGLSEIGTVYECENYGDIESTNGNYIGGIAGKSESSIRKSYAKNKLSGKRYIGGIAGKGDIITACCSIVNVSDGENIGSVCGDAASKEKLSQNLFVDRGLGAVDGISYKGKAEPVGFDDLKNKSGIPSRFISFTVTFKADDIIVETQEIKYGDDTSRIKYPDIPQKDGYFGNWQQPEAETVTENIELICEYKPYITILSSTERNESGKLALGLAEGEFTDKAVLHITESSETPPAKANGNVKLYDTSLSGTDIKRGDTVTLRILNENKDNVTAWQLKDGNWEQLETAKRGKYVILQTTGPDSTICLQYMKTNMNFILFIIIALVIMLMLIIVKKKKRRK